VVVRVGWGIRDHHSRVALLGYTGAPADSEASFLKPAQVTLWCSRIIKINLNRFLEAKVHQNTKRQAKGSKIATRVQKQVARGLWLQSLPETFKGRNEAPTRIKLLTAWTLAYGKLPHNMLHWENLRTATTTTAAAAGSKPACETFNRPNSWAPHVTWNSSSHPWDNLAQPLGRLTPPQKNWKTNSKL
jgi:hypothetical protein